MKTDQAAALSWLVAVTDIPDGGLKRTRVASEAERAGIAKALGLVSLDAVDAAFAISRLAGGGYHLTGTVTADLKQACVVTLEPVGDHLDETIDVEFWPADSERKRGSDDDGERGESNILQGPDVEKFDGGAIDVGRIVFETISAGLDPFPRADGAEFNWAEKPAAEPEKTSPFAALGKLKTKP